MKYTKSIFLAVVGLFNLLPPLYAQTITRDEFLNRLKQVHPLFEKENLTARIEKEDRKALAGAEDWNLLSSMTYSHEQPAIAGLGPERTDAISAGGGFEKLFWKTGGRLSTSLSFNRVDLKIDPLYGFPDTYYQNQFSITYIHPLSQNRNGFLDRFGYELKRFDIDFSEIQALENQESFLARFAKKFLDWVFLAEQEKIVSERLALSKEALANIRKKREANLVDAVDVLRAEDAVRISKQNLVLVLSKGNGLQAELAVLSQNDDLYNLKPEYDLYEIESLPPQDDAMLQLKRDSRLIKTLNIRIQQLKYSRLGFEETMKPQLSLLAQFNIKNAGENFGEALGMDKPDVIGGLQFSVPLGNRISKSRIAKTDLQVAQLEKQRDELTLDLEAALTNLYIQIEELKKVLTLNQEQIESAQAKTAEELRLYNQGRVDLTFVIQSQDGEQDAKLTFAFNALTHQKLLVEYRALMDLLL
jgi:outer membrane protein TolC